MSSEQYVITSAILPLVNLIEELEKEKETVLSVDVDSNNEWEEVINAMAPKFKIIISINNNLDNCITLVAENAVFKLLITSHYISFVFCLQDLETKLWQHLIRALKER